MEDKWQDVTGECDLMTFDTDIFHDWYPRFGWMRGSNNTTGYRLRKVQASERLCYFLVERKVRE